jgi:monoamine oxidase
MTGADMDATPMTELLAVVADGGGAYAVFSELAHVFGDGTTALVDALAADLGCPAERGRAVVAIRQDDTGVEIGIADGETVRAALCVLAVPINTMMSIAFEPPLAPERREPLTQGHVCRVTKVWMLATGVPDRMLAAGWQTPLHWLAAQAPTVETARGSAQLVAAFALDGALDCSDTAALERALRVYAPGARVLAADHHDWNADPWSRGGWAAGRVGWESAGVLDRLAAPHGRVLPAGSDIAPEFAGWIAGAVVSGRGAAVDALRRLAAPAAPRA